MKKKSLFLLFVLIFVAQAVYSQAIKETLVSNVWKLNQLVVDGESVPIPISANMYDTTGNIVSMVSNNGRLIFSEQENGLYYTQSNIPYTLTSSFNVITDNSITLAPGFLPAVSSTIINDPVFEAYRLIFLNDYVNDYAGGNYTIVNNVLTIGSATTYAKYNIAGTCSFITQPLGPSEQLYVAGQTLSDLEIFIDTGNVLLWYADEALTVQLGNDHLVQETTYYAIQALNLCKSSPLAVTISTTLNLNNTQLENLKIFPNPAFDVVNINYSTRIEKVEVFDLAGRKVLSENFDSNVININTHNLNAGVYILNVYTLEGVGKKKIIKK